MIVVLPVFFFFSWREMGKLPSQQPSCPQSSTLIWKLISAMLKDVSLTLTTLKQVFSQLEYAHRGGRRALETTRPLYSSGDSQLFHGDQTYCPNRKV